MGKGRKRKVSERQPNGQPARSRPAERQQTMDVATAQRARFVSAVQAGDQRAGFAYGRAFLLRMITIAQYKAAAEVDACETLYRAAMGFPRHSPAAINMDGIIRHGGREFTVDEVMAIRRRRDVRARLLMKLGRTVYDVVQAVVMMDQPVTDANLFILREALNALGKLSRNEGGKVLTWRENDAIPKLSKEFWDACVEAANAA